MSIYITTNDSDTVSISDFVNMIDRLNDSLNNCGRWVAVIIKLISEIKSNNNYSKLLSAETQEALSTCIKQLEDAQTAILATFGRQSP